MMNRKILVSTIITVTLLIGSVGSVLASETENKMYSDVNSSHWASASISDMSSKKIIAGYQDGTFKPAQTLTYGEFIKMMVVASVGEELKLAEKPNHWAYNYYLKGIELGLYSSNDISKDLLDQQITRKYMALIVSNGLENKGAVDYNELGERIANHNEIEAKINDVDSTVKYNYHIIRAYAAGIISGYQDGTFKPDGTLTRAESTIVLQRFLDPEKRTALIKSPYTVSVLKGAGLWENIQLESYEITLPSKNISSISKGEKWIKVVTDKEMNFVLYASDKAIPPVGNADGTDYFKEGNSYIYYFNPSNSNITNKTLAVQFMDDQNSIYIIKGVKF